MSAITADEINATTEDSLGRKLAQIREQKGLTIEYVAGKLNLRVRMIELIESDTFQELPQPVFVKGYLRAYAKLLEVSPEPYLLLFNAACTQEKKVVEKMLWQTKRDPNKGEQIIRWTTAVVVIAALLAVSFWWQKSKENPPQTSLIIEKQPPATTVATQKTDANVSTLQSLFTTTENETKV